MMVMGDGDDVNNVHSAAGGDDDAFNGGDVDCGHDS